MRVQGKQLVRWLDRWKALGPSSWIFQAGMSQRRCLIVRVRATLSNRIQSRPPFASNIDPLGAGGFGRGIATIRMRMRRTEYFSPSMARGAERAGIAIGGAASGAVFEPPARVAGLDDIAMVRQPVEHGGGHFGVAEHLRPVGEGEVCGDQ